MHKDNIHDQSHTIQADTVINVVHPTLGYVHNDWLLYYDLCTRLRLAHYTYNRDIMLSFPPSFLATF
jgi:hypothetical protein